MHGFCKDSVRIMHGSKKEMEPFKLSEKTLNPYVLKKQSDFVCNDCKDCNDFSKPYLCISSSFIFSKHLKNRKILAILACDSGDLVFYDIFFMQ